MRAIPPVIQMRAQRAEDRNQIPRDAWLDKSVPLTRSATHPPVPDPANFP